MEKMSDLVFEPVKTKMKFINVLDLIFKEGGSYLWIIFFFFVCGVFFDIGFWEISMTPLLYKILVLLFGLLLSIGMCNRIWKIEPKIQEKNAKRNKYVEEYNKKVDEFNEQQSNDYLDVQHSFNELWTKLVHAGLNIWSAEKNIDSNVTEYYKDFTDTLLAFRKKYFTGVKSNVSP